MLTNEQMKTITYEQFISFKPCWLGDDKLMAKVKAYAKLKPEWSALDILALEDEKPADKLWLVLREQLIDAPILHEFACRWAEYKLKPIDNPDPRIVEAIRIKRLWLKGEATDEELAAARVAVRDAAYPALFPPWWVAARDAAAAARAAAGAAAWVAQVEMLKELLLESEGRR